jgi:restriction system protein
MARRQSSFEDLMDIASRLSWHTCLVSAVVSFLILHGVAASFSSPAPAPDLAHLTSQLSRTLIGTFATFLQFIVPAGFLAGGTVSFVRQSQGRALFKAAQAHSSTAIRAMSWRQFERLVGEGFRRQDYEVIETGQNGADGGVDLVLKKNGEKTFVQCKQWRSQRVGVVVVRELYGVMAARGAAQGCVVTCGTFTPEARQFAKDCNVDLLDGDALSTLIREVGPPTASTASPAQTNADIPACPQCGSTMLKRVAKRGGSIGKEFWGCSTYPRCTKTLSLP